jgi:hypothetical protein
MYDHIDSSEVRAHGTPKGVRDILSFPKTINIALLWSAKPRKI